MNEPAAPQAVIVGYHPVNERETAMKLNDVLPIFKTKAAIADLLQIRPQNVAKWKKRGNLVPEAHRATLMLAAHGKLKVSASQIEQWEQEKAKLNRAIRLAQR